MEPLIPFEYKLTTLLEKAHDIIRVAEQLKGYSQPNALRFLLPNLWLEAEADSANI